MAMGNHRHFFCLNFNFLHALADKGGRRCESLSSRSLWISLVGLLLFFGGINHLITRPSATLSNPWAGQSVSSLDRSPASVDSRVLVSEINTIIQEHPKMIGSHFSGVGVLGVNLEDPEEVTFLMSPEGRAEFFSRFKGTQNFDSVIADLEQAWNQATEDDLLKREALLEMSVGLTNFTQNEKLKNQILSEYDRFNQSAQRPEARDYAARALQEFLDHETDPQKRDQELEKRGIPILKVSPNKTNN
jgi:hypothetical protein